MPPKEEEGLALGVRGLENRSKKKDHPILREPIVEKKKKNLSFEREREARKTPSGREWEARGTSLAYVHDSRRGAHPVRDKKKRDRGEGPLPKKEKNGRSRGWVGNTERGKRHHREVKKQNIIEEESGPPFLPSFQAGNQGSRKSRVA